MYCSFFLRRASIRRQSSDRVTLEDKGFVSSEPDSELPDSNMSVFLRRVSIRRQKTYWVTLHPEIEVLLHPCLSHAWDRVRPTAPPPTNCGLHATKCQVYCGEPERFSPKLSVKNYLDHSKIGSGFFFSAEADWVILHPMTDVLSPSAGRQRSCRVPWTDCDRLHLTHCDYFI